MRTMMMNSGGLAALSLLTPAPPTDGDSGAGGGAGTGDGANGAAGAGQGTGDGAQGAGGDKGGQGGAADKGGKGAKGGAGGGQQQAAEAPWYDSLPDDLKNHRTVQRHAKLEDALTSLVAAESKMGVPADQLVRLPTDDAGRVELYRKLGAPDAPEGYGITVAEGASDADKAMAADYAKFMFEKGPFPADAVAAAAEFLNTKTAEQAAQLKADMEQRAREGEAELRQVWGAAYDSMTKEIGLMLADEKLDGGKELLAELEATDLGDKTRLLRFLGKIVELRREPGPKDDPGGKASGSTVMTPAAAKAARIALENDAVKGAAMRDKAHPQHASVIAERNRYFDLEQGRDPGSTTGA